MTRLTIKKAKKEDFEAVMDFYHSMTDRMKERGFTITWVRDVHPSPSFVKGSIAEGSLYTGVLENRIVSAMVLNHRHAPQCCGISWARDLEDNEFLVIHALGVDPDMAGKGTGAAMIRQAVMTAKESGAAALRLDVLDTNKPARNLYLRCGFEYRGEAVLFYENTGHRIFEMYEMIL